MHNKIITAIFFLMIFALTACSDISENDSDDDFTDNVVAEYRGGDGSVIFFWGRSLVPLMHQAQSFQASEDTTCSSVRLQIDAIEGTPTGNYTVQIVTDNAGSLSSSVVSPYAVAVKNAAALSAYSWNAWDFSDATPLTGGQTYWIVCLTDEPAGNGNRLCLVGDAGDGYTDGLVKYYFETGASWEIWPGGHDLNFIVYK